MNDLEEALAGIAAIRGQISRSAEFRGYGPMTVAATGIMAVVAGQVQTHSVANPMRDIGTYLAIWTATAAISVTLIGVEMITRSRTLHSGLATEMIWSAVEQLVPAAVAGILITSVLLQVAPEALWMLPGLWQVLAALGVFACVRFLPRATFMIAVWYLSVPALHAWPMGRVPRALAPWQMTLPFAIGQLGAASVLHLSQRDDDAHV
jgi:hypothetical protein